jgi:branched-chain amino acid aminotransferase
VAVPAAPGIAGAGRDGLEACRMAVVINVNGRITDGTSAVVPVLDHGFLYGEGVYEVIRTYSGKLFLFDRHMQRMRQSAAMIRLPVPFDDVELQARIAETIAVLDRERGARGHGPETYVRVLLTRGIGEISYNPAFCRNPTLVIIVKPLVPQPAEVYERGVKVVLVPIVRNHPGSVSPLIKSNNLLNNALAAQQAFRESAFEAVMRNYRGELSECSLSNLFVVRNGAALTPPIDAGLLAGITRAFLFEVGGAADVPVAEAPLRDADLLEADEAFLTGTTLELVPIVRVDDKTIGIGQPGPITRKLLQQFRSMAQARSRAV